MSPAGVNALGGLFTLLIPETLGRSLEELNKERTALSGGGGNGRAVERIDPTAASPEPKGAAAAEV